MAAVMRALTENWDEMLAVGLGIVITDLVGDTVSGWVSQYVPAKWLDPVTEILIGIGILFVGEWIAPIGWKAYTRLASFGAIGIGIANAIGIAFGLKSILPRGGGGSPEGGSEGVRLI